MDAQDPRARGQSEFRLGDEGPRPETEPTAEARNAKRMEGAVAMGSFTSEPYKLTQPGFEYTITGLSAGTNYDIYIVAEDYALDSALRPAPNAGPVTRVDATTLA